MRSKSLLSAAIALFVVLACTQVHAGLLEQIQQMAGNSESSTTSASPAAKTAALAKFAASGTLSTTIQAGSCPNVASCATPTTCDTVQFSGPVTATSLGASTLTACMTVDNTAFGVDIMNCFNGLGTGTLTSKSGKNSVTLAFSGLLCIADESPLPTPTSAVFQVSGAYSVESGTGSFANTPSGAGSLSLSIPVANIGTPPFVGSGPISLTGNIAK